jgi:hypothetical protein
MGRKVVTFALLVLVAVVWTACGAAAPAPAQPMSLELSMPAESPGFAANETGAGDAGDRMVVQTAEMGLVVKDAEATATAIRELVNGLGGFVSNTNLYHDGSQIRGSIAVRVPAERLDDAMQQLKAMAVRVLRENLSGEDVTQEYTDLSARLRNLEATETELLAMLTEVRQKPNATAEDILQVYNQLVEIRGQIEQTKGRMQYLENLATLATITIELVPDEAEQPVIEEGWQPAATLRSAANRLVNSLQGLADLAIWLAIYVLPILIILALPIILIIWLVRRNRRRHPKPAAPTTPSAPPPTDTPPAA